MAFVRICLEARSKGNREVSIEMVVYIASTMTFKSHNVGRRYIGMARMHASRKTFSKPPNSQTKKL